jgi:hypothetical protein
LNFFVGVVEEENDEAEEVVVVMVNWLGLLSSRPVALELRFFDDLVLDSWPFCCCCCAP